MENKAHREEKTFFKKLKIREQSEMFVFPFMDTNTLYNHLF